MWGQAGGISAQGQPFSRFQLGGDPTPYYPLLAGGSMEIVKPAHMMGATGGAYRYGATKVGGITNMVMCDGQLYPLINSGIQPGDSQDIQLLLGGTGGNNYNAIVNGRHSQAMTIVDMNSPRTPGIMVNGEFAWQDTTGAAGHYGAMKEQFTVSGTGVTVNNGTTAVTGVGGTTWTTDALAFGGYAANYAPQVPALNAIRSGDLLEVVTAGAVSQFYRIVSVNSNTSLTIFPAFQAANVTNVAYKIWRTGFGSFSRNQVLVLSTGNMLYYAGNVGLNTPGGAAAPFGYGTIQAVSLSSATHWMAPTLAGGTITPAAVDVIYYKGFLLYGAGSAISWSVAGFPTVVGLAGNPPFGATDFPPLNISAQLSAGTFLFFEQIGEQVLAIFDESIWLIQATGSVPEFAFYRLPEVTGGLSSGIPDPQGTASISFSRPCVSAPGTVFTVTPRGLTAIQNLSGQPVSAKVNSYDFPGGDNNFELQYDASQDLLYWGDCGGTRGLLLKLDTGTWSVIDMSGGGALGTVKGMAGRFFKDTGADRAWRAGGLCFWQAKRIYGAQTGPPEVETTATSSVFWTWASPIVCQGEMFPGFVLGGIRPICRAAAGQNPIFTLTVYAGNSPFNMVQWGAQIVVNYQYGVASSRYAVSNGKCDSAYIGFVLTGANWIELSGLALYSAETPPAR